MFNNFIFIQGLPRFVFMGQGKGPGRLEVIKVRMLMTIDSNLNFGYQLIFL